MSGFGTDYRLLVLLGVCLVLCVFRVMCDHRSWVRSAIPCGLGLLFVASIGLFMVIGNMWMAFIALSVTWAVGLLRQGSVALKMLLRCRHWESLLMVLLLLVLLMASAGPVGLMFALLIVDGIARLPLSVFWSWGNA